ncbi:MAG: FG-GAP-like repeat-containing protein [Crocinitomicaceae bacterium]|nr:FG-GAP-like repeat-containing protein [Crocinitomicaceae bacterium]
MNKISKFLSRITITITLVLVVQCYHAQNFVNIAPSIGIYHSVNTNLMFGGNGVCFFDFDNDGWDDITFIQENDSILFYKNVNGDFSLIPSFVFNPGQTRQVLWVDYDNDGDNDLFITATNGLARLLNNDGLFNFTDVSIAAGLSGFNTNNFGVSFGDYDRDGHLDFYLARYSMTGNVNDPNQTNALYKNNGDGTFTNVTAAAGVGNGIQPSFMGVWIDVDHNSWPDLYVINDRVLWGNALYLNNGDGTFTDYTVESNADMFGEDPMGANFEDFDNDNDLDILCTNGGPPTKPIRLYKNLGDSTFVNVATALGIEVNVINHCTWGSTWIDIDNDSYRDLYVTTGLLTSDATNEIRSYLFRSNSANSFDDSPGLFTSNHVAASYSCAKGDYNNDGFADLVVQNAKNFNSFIWKNTFSSTSANNYLKVTLEGVVSNKMAIGSWINVYCDNNIYSHFTRAGEGFVSQNSQHYIFGVGDYLKIDSIVVTYPSGTVDTYYNNFTNFSYHFVEGETITNEIGYSGNLILCEGDSLLLDAGDFESYLWSNGYAGRYLTVTQSGEYYVLVETVTGLMVPSDTLDIQVFDQPIITYNIEHATCSNSNDGSISLLINTNAQSPVINWSNGGTGPSIQGLSGGIYSYNYIDEAGCTDTGQIEIFEPISISVFSQSTWDAIDQSYTIEFIIFGGTPPYEIVYNGNPVGDVVSGLNEGSHEFTITDQENCDTIVSIQLGENGLIEKDSIEFRVFPNPNSTGIFNIETDLSLINLQLFDALGKEISFSLETSRLNIGKVDKGIYYLRVGNQNNYFVQKLIVK